MAHTTRIDTGRFQLRCRDPAECDNLVARKQLQKSFEHRQPGRSFCLIRHPITQHAAPPILEKFERMARSDPSPMVRLGLASALQRLPLQDRWKIAVGLIAHEEDAADQNLPLMVWYGIEPLVPKNRARAVQLMAQCKIPLVRQFLSRRLAASGS